MVYTYEYSVALLMYSVAPIMVTNRDKFFFYEVSELFKDFNELHMQITVINEFKVNTRWTYTRATVGSNIDCYWFSEAVGGKHRRNLACTRPVFVRRPA